ncbi:hypothetical protein HY030_04340 [Candidatus Gottesmanbacteria bacterium]|nr:hypothetical protein [Candidatus Gottesmanbacteria bacterium]
MTKLPSRKLRPSKSEKKSADREKKRAKDLAKKTKLFGASLKKKGLKVINKTSDGEKIVIDLENLSGPAAGIFGDIVLQFLGLNISTSSDGAEQPSYSSTVTLNASTFMSGNVNTRDLVKMGDYLVEALEQVKRYRLPGDKRAQGQFLINFKEEIVTNKTLLEIKEQLKKILPKNG